jgi:GNAT superfamily N-acetyltransferase
VSVKIRNVRRKDAGAVAAIDAAHTRALEESWWESVVGRHTRSTAESIRVGLVAEVDGEVVGYLFGQIRAFEFGSEPCGWIYAVGVHPDHLRAGVATALFEAARRRFREKGARLVRTMVRRDDVPVLTFFRTQGFTGGPYVELEMPTAKGVS